MVAIQGTALPRNTVQSIPVGRIVVDIGKIAK
jgi:hypothetical protein